MAKLAMVLIQRLTSLKFGTCRWRKQHQRSTQTHPANKYFDTLSHQRAPNKRDLFMISICNRLVIQASLIRVAGLPMARYSTWGDGLLIWVKGLTPESDLQTLDMKVFFGSRLCKNSKVPGKVTSCGTHQHSQQHLADYFRHLLS